MRKITFSALEGARRFRFFVMESPAFENKRSLGTDVAGTPRSYIVCGWTFVRMEFYWTLIVACFLNLVDLFNPMILIRCMTKKRKGRESRSFDLFGDQKSFRDRSEISPTVRKRRGRPLDQLSRRPPADYTC